VCAIWAGGIVYRVHSTKEVVLNGELFVLTYNAVKGVTNCQTPR
jgi:hypothetical protein